MIGIVRLLVAGILALLTLLGTLGAGLFSLIHFLSPLRPRVRAFMAHRRGCDASLAQALAAEGISVPAGGTHQGNRVHLFSDGASTFADLFSALEGARHHVLVSFYILRNDTLGERFLEALERCADRGVRVFLLVDRVGSRNLPTAVGRRLQRGGVDFRTFWGARGGGRWWRDRFQVNYRNHRKIVVVDGGVGWLGGFNVGDEYLGRDPELGPWRDTFLKVQGPAAAALQRTFLEDWHWVTGELPVLGWEAPPAGEETVEILPFGPSDRVGEGTRQLVGLLDGAQRHLAITSPYFLPPRRIRAALYRAVARGVKVEVLIPLRSDSPSVDLASLAGLKPLLAKGIRIYRYPRGFLHAKTLVADGAVGMVSTANLDPRSLELNFEIAAILRGPDSVAELLRHFEADLALSEPLTERALDARPLWARLVGRGVALFHDFL